MSTVAQHTRSALRWLLTPLLLVIDRRIAWRSQQSDERLAHAERDPYALTMSPQLLAGALAPPHAIPPRPSAASELANPKAEGEATVVTALAARDEKVGFIDR